MLFIKKGLLFTLSFLVLFPANAQENFPKIKFSALADLRISHTISDDQSWLNGSLGKSRYGADVTGNNETHLNLSEASIMADIDFNWNLSGFIHAKFDPEQTNEIDLVEAFIKYNKLFTSGYKLDARLGTYFPHISLENVDKAWTSPYSITPSAINSWIGEEIKTTGLEIAVETELDEHAFKLTAATFMLNDPAGTLLAFRGWALHDSKSTIFGRFPLPGINSIGPGSMFEHQDPYVVPHFESDNRIGYYAGIDWEYFGILRLNSQYYNNRGNPASLTGGQYAWNTEFVNVGLSLDIFEETEIFGQVLKGNTKMGALTENGWPINVDYDSFYILLSHPIDKHRFTVRFDHFSTSDNSYVIQDNNNETGHSFLGAYVYEAHENAWLFLEVLHINSTRENRVDLGLAPKQKETQLQASIRVTF